MVIERPVCGSNAWDDNYQRRLSRRSILAIGLVAAVHATGALYLYEFATAPPKPLEEPGGLLIQSVTLPKEPPKQPNRNPPPRPVLIHNALGSLFKPPVVLDSPPQKAELEVGPGPALLADKITSTDIGALSADPHQTKVIRDPMWLARPTNQQLVEFYPPRALDDGITGYATLDCFVTASGLLTRCSATGETPRDQGFADAALKAARLFRMSPKFEDGQPVEGGLVHIPMRFAVQ